MTTPPGWAYSYATVWETFDSGARALLTDAASVSGGHWVMGVTTDVWIYRGLAGVTGTTRTGIGGTVPEGTDGGGAIGNATIAVPGASSQGCYVRSEIYLDTNTSPDASFELQLLDASASGVYSIYLSGDAYERLGVSHSFAGSFDFPVDVAVSVDLSGWHLYELRYTGTDIQMLVDGNMLGSALVPPFAPALAGLVLAVSGTPSTPSTYQAYADNFEAGPLAAPVVPVLTGGPRSDLLHFEFRH